MSTMNVNGLSRADPRITSGPTTCCRPAGQLAKPPSARPSALSLALELADLNLAAGGPSVILID